LKAVVLGIGRMGTAIAWAMDKLGFDVCGMDTNVKAANNMPKGNFSDFFVVDDVEDIFKGLISQKRPDILISSLPYHQTEKVGLWCIDNDIRYCDLGGKVDVSKNINDAAINYAARPVMTDLGLAPGLVNILAEEGCRRLYGEGEITNVEMMVGGLPDYLESNKNPLRYGITWSIAGLINEYKDDCIILEDGQIKTVKGMDGLETLETETLGVLEAFYTSGGASHSIPSMMQRGVKNCSYKTLRYKGHRDIVKFLIRDCGLSTQTLAKIFVEGCGYVDKDEVIVIAKVKKPNKTWRKEKLIKSDENFSAMQKGTAFPIASVAALMAEGLLEGDKDQHRDYYTKYPKNLSYRDIPFDKFSEKLNTLGLDL
jgi:saccharopine dehydrogenase-like NADP-dependent oxidoreductase